MNDRQTLAWKESIARSQLIRLQMAIDRSWYYDHPDEADMVRLIDYFNMRVGGYRMAVMVYVDYCHSGLDYEGERQFERYLKGLNRGLTTGVFSSYL